MSWKTIPSFPNYECSHKGKIRNKKTNKIVGGYLNESGYRRCCLTNDKTKKQLYVHRIVAFTFITNPDNYDEVHHINGKRDDNRSSNLMWVTHQINMKFIYDKTFNNRFYQYKNQKLPINLNNCNTI